ncbi:MAG: DUF1788 domain-containing protein [bacterium]|nr:DUF1788 domain-containing protein [bacterium]
MDNKQFNDHDVFEHLSTLLKNENFLQKKGLANEVPFFICPYPPAHSAQMEDIQQNLINSHKNSGVHILVINLFDLAVELLKKRNIWETILEREPTLPREELKELLQGTLDAETILVPAIAEKMKETEFGVMFVTGVGEVFPYIRVHYVLNNLQSSASEKPTVIFYPGEYNQSLEGGSALKLFGILEDDKYYRAFNIFRCDL